MYMGPFSDILNHLMGIGTMFDAAWGHGVVVGSGISLLAKLGYPLCGGGFW